MTFTLITRSLIIYLIVFLMIRLMGKRQIGEMQPFEFVITLLIAELACLPLSDVSIPLVYGIIAVLVTFVLHQTISVIEQFGQPFKLVFSGKPSLVINKNGIDVAELKAGVYFVNIERGNETITRRFVEK